MLGALAAGSVAGDGAQAFVPGSLYRAGDVHVDSSFARPTRPRPSFDPVKPISGLVFVQWVWKDGKMMLVVHNRTDEPVDVFADVHGVDPLGEPMRFDAPPDPDQLHFDVVGIDGQVLPVTLDTRIEWGSFRT